MRERGKMDRHREEDPVLGTQHTLFRPVRKPAQRWGCHHSDEEDGKNSAGVKANQRQTTQCKVQCDS